MKAEKCQATARDGNPCSATPRPGRPYCLWHDPQAEELRREISRKGGASRSNKARAAKALGGALTPPQIAAVLSQTLVDLRDGATEPGVASAMVSVARVLVGMYGTWTVDYLAGQQDVVGQAVVEREAERLAAELGIPARELLSDAQELAGFAALIERVAKEA